jgi:putative ATPase
MRPYIITVRGGSEPTSINVVLKFSNDIRNEMAAAPISVELPPSVAPKSNAVYSAYNAVRELVKGDGTRPVPPHLRNAPTRLMKTLGHGQGYRYAHDEDGGFAAGEHYLPDGLPATRFYEPVPRGLELRIGERLAELRALNATARRADGKPG